MTEFGTYVLKYKAPKGSGESKVKMSISAEATVTEMLAFFSDFLRGSGYVFDGDIVIDIPREPLSFCENSWNSFWEEDGFSMTGNPYASNDTISIGSTSPTYSTSDYFMSTGNDNIILG